MVAASFSPNTKNDSLLPTYQRINLPLPRRHDAQEVSIQGGDALVRSWEEQDY